MKFEIIKKSILLGILIILLVMYYGMDNPKVERTYELKKDNSLAIMVYDETTEDYVSHESIPTGMYQLNKDKTYCVNGGKVTSYDRAIGKLNYTLNTDDKCYVYFDVYVPTLSDTVIALADASDRTSITAGSVYRVANESANIILIGEYVQLTQSQYGTTSEYKGSDSSSTSGTTTTGMFDYNTSDNTWTIDTMNMSTYSSYHLKIPVTEDGMYQICYKVPQGSSKSTEMLRVSVFDSSFSTLISNIFSVSVILKLSEFKCVDIGELTTNQAIKIVFDTVKSDSSVMFYLQKAPTQQVTLDAGIRYEGANPDNYVTYNDELWRIIGTFDGSDIGLEAGKKYTRIIRSNPYSGVYSWDCKTGAPETCKNGGEYINDWTEATLNTMLNTEYLNQTGSFTTSATDKGLGAEARGMIAEYNGNYSKWYLGGIGSTYSTDSSGGYYALERGNKGYNEITETNKLSTNAAIGLMYPSDYGYAMYGGESETTCINTTQALYDYSNCEQYDWLWLSGKNQWTITPYLTDNRVHYISSSGSVSIMHTWSGNYVRPTLYLSSDVKIVGGNGSDDSPYQLSL